MICPSKTHHTINYSDHPGYQYTDESEEKTTFPKEPDYVTIRLGLDHLVCERFDDLSLRLKGHSSIPFGCRSYVRLKFHFSQVTLVRQWLTNQKNSLPRYIVCISSDVLPLPLIDYSRFSKTGEPICKYHGKGITYERPPLIVHYVYRSVIPE